MLGMLAGGAVALLSGCGLFGNPSYRFKMTVDVETPEGLKTGSSVYEVETTGSRDLVAGGKGSRFMFRGEAVAVDLPDGRTLFALLSTLAMSGLDVLPVSSMVAMDPNFDYDWMASTKRIALSTACYVHRHRRPQFGAARRPRKPRRQLWSRHTPETHHRGSHR